MHYLWVGTVGDGCRGKEVSWFALGEPWKETVEPGAELRWRKNSAHKIGFHQAWREEVSPTRFHRSRTISVAGEIVEAALNDQPFQFLMACGSRIVEPEAQA